MRLKWSPDHLPAILKFGSPGTSRTCDISINSAALYQLSYWGFLSTKILYPLSFCFSTKILVLLAGFAPALNTPLTYCLCCWAIGAFEIGRADGNRTRVSGVTDQCNNHYTTALFEILLMYLIFG